jgi:hypothetical protein
MTVQPVPDLEDAADPDVRRVLDLEAAGRAAMVDGTAVEFFDRVMTSTAVLVLPGTVFERTQALTAWAGGPPWRRVEVERERSVHIGPNTIAVTYRARLFRPDSTHDVHITSVYTKVHREWLLGLRQQMPIPPFLG